MALFTGTSGDDSFYGEVINSVSQNDTFIFPGTAGGNDYADGLGGHDSLIINQAGANSPAYAQYIHAGNGNYVNGQFFGNFRGGIDSSVLALAYTDIESLSITFGDGNDIVFADASPLASGGSLSLDGGFGNNTLDIAFSQTSNTTFVVQSNGQVVSNRGNYANFATYSISTGGGTNTVTTAGGDDAIYSTGGSNSVDGGYGYDRWNSYRTDAATYHLSNTASVTDTATGLLLDTASNIEHYNIYATNWADTFHVDGSAKQSLIYAVGGNDSLFVDFRGAAPASFGPHMLSFDGGLYHANGGVQWFGVENFDVILDDGNSNVIVTIIAGSTYRIDGGLGENTLQIIELSTNFTRVQDGDSYIFTSLDGAKSFTLLRIDHVLFADGWVHLPRPGVTITGTAANDTISPTKAPAGQPKATDLADTIYGLGGNDKIDGGKGGDKMVGGIGNDNYTIDDAFDSVEEAAGEGTDTVQSAKLSFTLAANVENGTLTGALALDITGNELVNSLTGNTAANDLYGMAGKDKLNGKAGDDFLYGGNDDDTLTGDLGFDTLYGDAGKDKLNGGAGIDVLTGGSEADQFVFDANALDGSVDQITDFSHAQKDRISLSAIDANGIAADGNSKFAFIGTAAFGLIAGQLRYETAGGNATVQADINGDGVADLTIALTGVTSLLAADFVL